MIFSLFWGDSMSVPYIIDGVVGDGTEQNPYQVTTMDQLFSCCAVVDAYVCLMNDIHCELDQKYKVFVTDTLVIDCAKLYSEGTRKIIYNWNCQPKLINSSNPDVTLSTRCCIRNESAGTVIDNISFEGCVFRQTLYNQSTLSWSCLLYFSDTTEITNSNFSFFMDFSKSITQDNTKGEIRHYIQGGRFYKSSIHFNGNQIQFLTELRYYPYMSLFSPTIFDCGELFATNLYFDQSPSTSLYPYIDNVLRSLVVIENGYFYNNQGNDDTYVLKNSCRYNIIYFTGRLYRQPGEWYKFTTDCKYPNLIYSDLLSSKDGAFVVSDPSLLSDIDYIHSVGIF